jgi:uncharacterized SAM-binding protein YcdF (DUF218 family)
VDALRQLLTPYPLLLLTLGVALVWVWRKHPKPRRRLWLLIVPYLLLVLLSSPISAYYAQGSLEWKHPPLQQRPDDIDAIVVLGSYAFPANRVRPQPELDEVALSRTHAAALLYRQGKPVPIIVTGGKPNPNDPAPTSAEVMAEVLRQEGVDKDLILVEKTSQDTAENAANSAALLREHGWKRIAVVTDSWHLPRAVACFEKQGFDVVPAGCNYRAIGFELRLNEVVPSVAALENCERAAREWRSRIWYRLRGLT